MPDSNDEVQAIAQRYGAIFSGVPAELGLAIHRTNSILYANDNFLRFIECDGQEQLQSLELMHLVAPESKERMRKRMEERATGGTPAAHFDAKLLGLRGGEKRVEGWSVPISDEPEPLIQTIFVDVSDKVRAKRALEESERRYRGLFDSMLDGFALHEMIYDDDDRPCDYRFLAVNPAFVDSTGLTREVAVGHTVKEILPEIEPYWIETYGKVVETGEPITFENYTSQLGKHYKVTAYRPREGQFATIFIDVTNEKQAQMKLERNNELLAEFAYAVAHDLKAPIRGIGFIKQLLDKALEAGDVDQAKELSDRLGARAGKMAELVDGILAYSRLDSARDPAEHIDIAALIGDVISEIDPPESMRVRMRIDVKSVRSVEIKLRQVLTNLVCNAITHHDRESGEITVTAADAGDDVLITVADDGPGIAEQYRERVFEVFQTLEPAQDSSNTGVGLAIAKKAVESMGGRISAGANEPRGSKFEFTLPKHLQ